MQCPVCNASVPTSFRCKACGAELMGSTPRPSTGGPPPPRPPAAAPTPRAPRAQADVNPYAAPVRPVEPHEQDGALDEAPIQFLAGRLARFLAQLLDGLFALLWIGPGFVLILVLPRVLGPNSRSAAMPLGLLALLLLLGGVVGLLVYQLRLLAREGQTWGKKQMNVRIVTYDSGEIPGLGRTLGLRIVVNNLIGMIPLVGAVYSLIDPLLIFGEERRCLHDLLAGTTVVEAS